MSLQDQNESETSSRDIWCSSLTLSLLATASVLFIGRFAHQILWSIGHKDVAYDVNQQVSVIGLNFSLEAIDRLVWVSSLVVVIVFFLPQLGVNRFLLSKVPDLWLSLAIIVLSLSILVVPIDGRYKGVSWWGWGPNVFFAVVVVLPILHYIRRNTDEPWIGMAPIFAVPLIGYFYIPTLIQPLWAIKDLYHSAYVINEVLAPMRGVVPSSDMAALYTTLIGLPVVPLVKVLGISDSIQLQHITTAYLSTLAVSAVVIMSVVVYKISPKSLKQFLVLFVVVFVFVTPNGSMGGGISSSFTTLSVRVFPIMVIALLLLIGRSRARLRVILIGFTAGFTAVNNIEFGVPALVSVFAVFALLNWRKKQAIPTMSYLIAGILGSWTTYILLLSLFGKSFRLEYFLLYVRTFGRGFYSIPMQVVGAHLFVLPLLVAGTVVGGSYLIRRKNDASSDNEWSIKDDAAIISLYFGVLGLLSFSYFVNRSAMSNLGIFLLFVGPIIASSFTLLGTGNLMTSSQLSMKKGLLVLIPQALLVGSIFQMPNGHDEWARVTDTKSTSYRERLVVIKRHYEIAQIEMQNQIKYFSIGQGNLFLGDEQVSNVSLIDDPTELNDPLYMETSLVQDFCKHLDESIALNELVFVEQFGDKNSGQQLCLNYKEVLKLDDGFSVVKKL
jgi:hypothetical protein